MREKDFYSVSVFEESKNYKGKVDYRETITGRLQFKTVKDAKEVAEKFCGAEHYKVHYYVTDSFSSKVVYTSPTLSRWEERGAHEEKLCSINKQIRADILKEMNGKKYILYEATKLENDWEVRVEGLLQSDYVPTYSRRIRYELDTTIHIRIQKYEEEGSICFSEYQRSDGGLLRKAFKTDLTRKFDATPVEFIDFIVEHLGEMVIAEKKILRRIGNFAADALMIKFDEAESYQVATNLTEHLKVKLASNFDELMEKREMHLLGHTFKVEYRSEY